MAKIRINGDTSGYIEISAPAVAGSTSITLPATTGGSLLATDASGNLNVDSGTFYVDGTNNRVGIGTSSPSSLLHVEGTSGNAKIRLGTGGDHTLIGPDSSGHTIINAGTAGGNMQLQLAGSTKVTLNSTGLGIGTTGPTELLSIGFADSSSGKLEFRTSTYSKVAMIEGSHDGGTANGSLRFWTRSGGTESERARIDSSGRLLVGTSTARTPNTYSSPRIQIEATSFTSAALSIINNENNNNEAGFVIGKSRGTSVNGITIVNSNDTLGQISFQGADGTNLIQAAIIKAEVDGTPGTNDMPGRLVFSTTVDGGSSPTSRFTINKDGSTRVTARAGIDCFYSTTPTAAGTSVTVFRGGHSATDGNPGTGTDSFYVFANGNVQNTNGSYTTISDIKLKENIVDAGSQWNDLKAIKIRNWNFKAETGNETHRQIGPIAQELETVCPGLVFETPDRDADGNETGEVTKGVNQSVLYMKAVKALQEAMERIEQLEAKVAALESA